MMILVIHVQDLSDALPASFPGTRHIYRKEHPAYLSQNGARLVMWGLFWLGAVKCFCVRMRERKRLWLDYS